ncbi:hypothetical protein TNCV_5019211 [Trichonephila clavipes]|nr:hypothetical protein TNCV_5019211 [Trichonephila clavipes]
MSDSSFHRNRNEEMLCIDWGIHQAQDEPICFSYLFTWKMRIESCFLLFLQQNHLDTSRSCHKDAFTLFFREENIDYSPDFVLTSSGTQNESLHVVKQQFNPFDERHFIED